MNTFSSIFFLLIVSVAHAQQKPLDKIGIPDEKKNVHVLPLQSDSLSSAFLIFIRERVPLHLHEHHTESVYVLEGTGEMILGDDTFIVRSGDFVFIPPKTPHAVKVRSEPP